MNENNQTIYEEFGMRIREIRKMKKLTQKDLSSLMNVTQSTIVAIEKGQRRIPLNMIYKFCEVFDMPYEELVNKHNSHIEETTNNKSHLTKYEVNQERIPFINEDKKISAHYERWLNIIGYEHFTDEEIDQLIDYAQYLISKRK